MRQHSHILTTGLVLLCILLSALAGCSRGSEEQGRIRVGSVQVVGNYQLDIGKGSERLQLKADGTYVQDTLSQSKPIHRIGRWYLKSHFFDGSEVVLEDAVVTPVFSTEEGEKIPRGLGEIQMYVHNRAGGIALARSEVTDWYYERTQ